MPFFCLNENICNCSIAYFSYMYFLFVQLRRLITLKLHFQASDYPLILSLENHCSPKQQEVMVDYLRSILGDKLVTFTIDETMPTELPSPEVTFF